MKTAEMNALKCLVFPVFFFHQWIYEKKVPVTTNGGALFETQEQSVREGGFKTVTRVSGIKVYFKSFSLLTPNPRLRSHHPPPAPPRTVTGSHLEA